MTKAFLLLAVVLIPSVSPSGLGSYRLPNSTSPVNYEIHLKVNPILDTFNGSVKLWIKAVEPTNTIVLHSSGLTNLNIEVLGDGNIYKNHTTSKDDTDFLRIELFSELNESKTYQVNINYTGRYGLLDGLYRGSYMEKNSRRYLLSTQFAAVSARKVFPCYDEPTKKAKFKYGIATPVGYYPISNMAAMNGKIFSDGYHETIFEETPVMSTYVLGFVVSEFVFKNAKLFDKNLRIYTRRDVESDTKFALDVTTKSLEELEEYTTVSYKMPKFDMVAVPDFKFSAMENWGLVIYKEKALLGNKNDTPTLALQKIATVISHENAHMWFGNEVTHAWWSYVWMKEGFATFFQNFITDRIFNGEWRQMEQFVVDSLQTVMLLDSHHNTSPMSSDVSSPEEILSNYDAIAYEKGASIIRMIWYTLGDEVFKRGVQNYLKNRLEGVATPDYLFEQLQAAIEDPKMLPKGQTVSTLFSTWTNQPSYPLIKTRYLNGTIELQQISYYKNPNVTTFDRWWIPLEIVTGTENNSNSHLKLWLEPEKVQYVPFNTSERWYLLNPQQTAYCRVQYEYKNWIELIKFLKTSNFTEIHPLTRAQLIDDACELAKTGRMHYNLTLDLLSYLSRETDYIPWVSAVRAINKLSSVMSGSERNDRYKSWLRSLGEKFYKSVNFKLDPNDNHITKRKRTLAFGLAQSSGMEGHKEKIKNLATSVFKKNMTSNLKEQIDPDLRLTVYCQGLMLNLTDYSFVWSLYGQERDVQEKSMLLSAMGCTPCNRSIETYLMESIKDGYDVRDHERHEILISVLTFYRDGCDATLDFLTGNFERLNQKSKSSSGIVSVIDALAEKISNEEQTEKFERFVEENGKLFDCGQRKAIERARGTMKLNEMWKERAKKDVDAWLLQNWNSSSKQEISLVLFVFSVVSKFLLNYY